MYWFKVKDLLSCINDVSRENSQKEYYLTSIIQIFIQKNLKVSTYDSSVSDIVLGANDCNQLQLLNQTARKNIINNLLDNGVNIPFGDSVVIGSDVKIEPGTTILPNTVIYGKTYIGKGCVIGTNCEIVDCNIEDGCKIKFSYCKQRNFSKNSMVSP